MSDISLLVGLTVTAIFDKTQAVISFSLWPNRVLEWTKIGASIPNSAAA